VNEIPQIQDIGCTPGACPSELELEQFHLGEGDPIGRAAVKRQVESCAGCTRRMEELTAGFAAFPTLDAPALEARILQGFEGQLPETLKNHLATDVEAKAETKGSWARLLGWLNSPNIRYATVGVGVAVLLSVLMPNTQNKLGIENGIRMKGNLTLKVQRSRGGLVDTVASGEQFQAGDRLRFEVLTPKAGHLLILGKESGGDVYVVYPLKGEGQSAAKPKGRQELPEAVELDGSGGTESLYAIFCPEPFNQGDVAFKAADIITKKKCQSTVFKLNKGP